MISGRTRLAAVIGHPVRHSLSPALHNAAFEELGLDWRYVAFDVAPGGASAALSAMRTLGLGGINVTMPHKGDV
ncbi:MAG TPA: shikimate dehydrogenase, partial [Acidimicrobiales bacterium]